MSQTLAAPPQPAVAHERRTTARLEVNGRIHGELETMNLPVRVREISLGGFSIETPEPVPDERHVVRFSVPNRWSISLSVWSRHSRPFCTTDGATHYVTGFEYSDPSDPQTMRAIGSLIERLASVLIFE